jgi:hypothetical protein
MLVWSEEGRRERGMQEGGRRRDARGRKERAEGGEK